MTSHMRVEIIIGLLKSILLLSVYYKYITNTLYRFALTHSKNVYLIYIILYSYKRDASNVFYTIVDSNAKRDFIVSSITQVKTNVTLLYSIRVH